MVKNGMKYRLDTGFPKYGNKPLVSKQEDLVLKERRITFSFAHFRQIERFEIGGCSQKWFVGLLDRLQVLGTLTPQELLEEHKGSSALRCHPIDWDLKNIPINRSDLNWLPPEIVNNQSEFPIMQISIATSTGRIIGYFDHESSVFYIVLLDPHHNLQPSKKHNYQIRPTTRGISQYDDLLNRLQRVKDVVAQCPHSECLLHTHISSMEALHDNIIYTGLDQVYYENYLELLQVMSLEDIIKNGIIASLSELG